MDILIAEDDQFLRDVFTKELSKAGYSVQCAENGEEALAVLSDRKPAAILLDILMPKVDGFHVLESCKNNPALADIPVIMLTSLGQEEDIRRAKELGAEGYFMKAEMDLDLLVSMVSRIIPREKSPINMQEHLQEFFTYMQMCIREISAALDTLKPDTFEEKSVFDVMRQFHSMKSSAAMMSFPNIAQECFTLERKFDVCLKEKTGVSADLLTRAQDALKTIQTLLKEENK